MANQRKCARSREKSDCKKYCECLTKAAKADAKCIPCHECTEYEATIPVTADEMLRYHSPAYLCARLGESGQMLAADDGHKFERNVVPEAMVWMYLLDGLSVGQIAERFGVSYRSIKRLVGESACKHNGRKIAHKSW